MNKPRDVIASVDMEAGEEVFVSYDDGWRRWAAWRPEPDRPNRGYRAVTTTSAKARKPIDVRYKEDGEK